MGFDVLGAALNTLAGVAENTPSGLDTPVPIGTGVQSFGALGAFAEKIDRSAQRQYIETGMIRNIRPRNMELLMQEPDVTILIKKRQFSSLSENYRFDLMNADEKLFVKASKILFYNKCRAIAAYERLTKIEKILVNNGGIISDTALPLIFSAVDTLNAISPGFFGSYTQSVIDTIRQVKAFSDPNFFTTWIVDPSVPYTSDTGQGTGVFELTTVASVSCTNTVNFMGGSAEITIEDPYKLMVITNDDIDKAIAGAANFFTNNAFFALTRQTLENTVQTLKDQLTSLRFGRGASDIKFIVNQSSLLYKKVRAIIDEDGTEIKFTFDGGLAGIGSSATLDESAKQGPNGLTDEEAAIFQQIISNIYLIMGSEQTTNNQILTFNTQTNYVRQRMRLEFGNKPIIQPMDVVHVFISSKTLSDSMLTQGLDINFAADSLLSQLNGTLGNIQNTLDNLSAAFGGGSGGSSYLEQEKNSIAGPDFPMWLWTLMRNDFTRQAAGTHVFAGIVDAPGATHTYDNGKYTLRVSAKDNTHYFSLGRINLNPSVDVYNGSLYDPLTPFNIQFDASSGIIRGEFPPLLDENIRLLSSGSAKAKLGRFRGSILDEDSYKILDAEKMASNLFRRKLSDPDGFVYRWKQGIGSLTLFGEPHGSTFDNERTPSLTSNPFAGQDVMNVLSLLITGQPYNFNNFVKAAITSGNLTRDDLFNINGTTSYFRGLISDISKNNSSLGNFLPFKKMIVNESGYRFLQTGEFDITTANRRATELLKERAKRFDELTSILPQFANSPQF
ncbi:MAG TPA: hypothetical protein VM577_08565 [Anaerovoracaceae bacterium]|nr:hypothetical protein [Anaerovoracaceae bacterium]